MSVPYAVSFASFSFDGLNELSTDCFIDKYFQASKDGWSNKKIQAEALNHVWVFKPG